jgi:hypothetical protein
VAGLDGIVQGLETALGMASRLVAGRLASNIGQEHRYNPVGYVLSADKDVEDEKMRRRRAMLEDREMRFAAQAQQRLLRKAVNY